VVAGIASAPFSSLTDAAWHDVPGAQVSLQLTSASPVALSWNLAIAVGGVVFTHVTVDGALLPGSQSILMSTGSTSGGYHVNLSGGGHVISLQYKTNSAFDFDPSIEFETAAIEAMAFDQ